MCVQQITKLLETLFSFLFFQRRCVPTFLLSPPLLLKGKLFNQIKPEITAALLGGKKKKKQRKEK